MDEMQRRRSLLILVIPSFCYLLWRYWPGNAIIYSRKSVNTSYFTISRDLQEKHYLETGQKNIFSEEFKIKDEEDKQARDNISLNLQQVATNLKGNNYEATNKFAVFGCTTPLTTTADKYNYIFNLPLTALAWWRIGFSSAVILIGSKEEWLADPILKYVLSKLSQVGARIFYVNAPLDNRIMMSQVSRLFISDLFSEHFNKTDYIVTADADLWPINGESYLLPEEKSFLLLNAHCETCVNFNYKGEVHRMFPMANVGARVESWEKLLRLMGNKTRTVSGVVSFLENVFGDVVRMGVQKGENEGWYIDQQLLTVLIFEWAKQYNYSSLEYRDRQIGKDRIDRNNWRVPYTLQGIVDVHLLDNMYQHNQMFRALQLARLMYEETAAYDFVLNYFDTFNNLMFSV